ncbi:MAG: class E sortase, partial [Solirubrobacteraceae bacterium]
MKLGNLRQARRSEMTAASISHAPLPPLPEFAARSPRPPRPGGPRPGGRRLLRLLTVIMAIGGSLMLIDGGLTLLWQEPVSALYAHFAQDRLNGDLRALDRAPPSAAERQALAAQSGPGPRMALLARQLQSTARTGSAVGQIHIPHIAANFVVVAGTDVAALRKGPGIYAQTSFPGMPGTVAIAGHRTTYLAPFRRINELVKGNRISIDMPYGRFTYVVQRHRIVAPTQVSVLSSVAGINQLVLTACHPLYSAAKRWVVFASLVSSEPRGAALGSAPVPSVPTPTPAPAQPSAPDLSAGAMLLGNAQHASPPALVPGQARASDLLFGLRLPATPHPASHLTSA